MSRGTLDPAGVTIVSDTGLSPSMAGFPKTVPLTVTRRMQSEPRMQASGLGSFLFARRYSGNRCFFLFLRVLRCFSSPRSLRNAMDSRYGDGGLLRRVSPFRNPRVMRIFAPNRGLSQLITSFIGSQCQGIRPALFLA